MPKIPSINSYQAIPPAGVEAANSNKSKSLRGKSISIIKKGLSGIDKFAHSPITAASLSLVSLAKYTANLTSTVFELITEVKGHPFTKGLRNVSIISLVQHPFTLYDFVGSLIGLGKAVKSGELKQMAHAALLAVAVFADVVEIPSKVAYVVDIFQSVPMLNIWGPALGAVSAILSTASLLITGLSHESTRKMARKLKAESQEAFLQTLKEELANPKNVNLVKAMADIDGKPALHKLEGDVTHSLELIAKAKNSKELKKIMAGISQQVSSLDPDLLRELEDVGNKAFIDSLKKKDAAFLKKHFRVKGKSLQVALDAIRDTPQERSRAVHNLKTRISDKLISNRLSFFSDTIGIVAAVILTVTGFVTAATPAAPVAFALLIGLCVFAIAKIIIEYMRKKQFEKAIGMTIAPVTNSPNLIHTEETKLTPQSVN